MSLIVMKFGGPALGDIDRIKNAAAKVATEARRGHQIAVVVSAMPGVTDQLIGFCRAIAPHYDRREHDTVVSTGEQVTSGLMALALQQRGLNARSWQGWQLRLLTDSTHAKAKILSVETEPLQKTLAEGTIAVVAGFQGVTDEGRVTTLGRGGADASAVALAVALKADRCDLYADAQGVYTTDPRLVSGARRIDQLSYEEMMELMALGEKFVQSRAVEIAMRHRMPVQILSAFANETGSDLPGTLLTERNQDMEKNSVTGIVCTRDEAKITLAQIPDAPGRAAGVFLPLAQAGISVGMIVQNASNDSQTIDITFTVTQSDRDRAVTLLKGEQERLGFQRILAAGPVARVSVVGVGMRNHANVAATMFSTLADKGINIQAIETSAISTSVVIGDDYTELALRALHAAYGLEKA